MGRLSMALTALVVSDVTAGGECLAYAPNFITKAIRESMDRPETKAVTTRFPPEPNGYLHLGHAKAISFNFAVARMFDGRCHMRLDDTNPSKEDQEYVDSILEDVRWIQSDGTNRDPWHGPVRKTSDYFPFIYQCAETLIRNGDAYVESLSADQVRDYRGSLTEPGRHSPFRTRSVQHNLDMFHKMREGLFEDGQHILRAKIDMSSPNLNLRDPALYRIKHEPHPSTGNDWCIYPMYDFSHPIADALEGITHSLCTLEFEDHRPLYDWTIHKLSSLLLPTLQQRPPQQIEFSRLNLKYTVLSKRKLIQLLQHRHVQSWDDPRMPTLSGVRRRGIPPSAIRLFCERVGISKADSNIDYTDLENCVREIMDTESARAFAILEKLKVTITNWVKEDDLEDIVVPRHPKIAPMGDRIIPFGKHLYMERSDFFDRDGPEGAASKVPKGFKRLLPDGRVRLKYAYVIQCDEVVRDPFTKEPLELLCTMYPETRAGVTPEGMDRIHGIIQWVEASTGVPCKINLYDRLFRAEEPGKETGNFLDDINPDSLNVLEDAVVEPSVALDAMNMLDQIYNQTAEGTKLYHSSLSYQFERNGYFALDLSSTGRSNLVFNRAATLRDTWVPVVASQNGASSSLSENGQPQRKRGGDKAASTATGGGSLEDLPRVAFRAGTILEVKPHPEAENLIVCKLDCGDEEPRTVVAGLAGKISSEDLVGKKVVGVTNLKPAKMRGIESTAILLVASNNSFDKVELLQIPKSVPNGELLSFEGKENNSIEPDDMLKSKGALKAFDRVKACLRTNEKGEAIYTNGINDHRMWTSAGPVTTSSLKNASIQ